MTIFWSFQRKSSFFFRNIERRSEMRKCEDFSGKYVSKFLFATDKASWEISMAMTSLARSTQEVAMIPEPVPMSISMLFSFDVRIFRVRFTSTSVSSRGMSTSGVTRKVLQKNTTDPVMYSSGKSGCSSFLLDVIKGFLRKNNRTKSENDNNIETSNSISQKPFREFYRSIRRDIVF